ncbi:hypothetical protein EP56_07725 [Listeriaceae bacterium FSL A5-0209]|nr:hypothetical protein EP56_07725 [Listeriaceae bacterium FSL A5-0209]
MTVIKIETKTSFEEVEIYGKSYKVEFSDAKMEEYDKAHAKMEKWEKEKSTKDKKDFKKDIAIVKDMLEMFFGKEDADVIYNDSGQSSIVCSHIGMQLFKVFKDKMEDFEDKKLEEYLGIEEDTEQKIDSE